MWNVINGNNIDILKTYPDNHFDSVVTDPPYGISFLGKDWDSKKATETTSKLVALSNLPSGMKHTSLADDLEFQYWMRDIFLECNRVLKPGGHLLAFSAARTYHHMAMAAQTAGFEIRDQLMWLYGSGFPKAQDIGKAIDKRAGKVDEKYGQTAGAGIIKENGRVSARCSKCGLHPDTKKCETPDDCGLKYDYQTEEAQQWAGWKTALKPAHEPIVMARKPFKGSTIDNVLEHGVGALNIDASRIGDEEITTVAKSNNTNDPHYYAERGGETPKVVKEITNTGRFPSNVIMDEVAGAILDEQAPKTGNGHMAKTRTSGYGKFGGGDSEYHGAGERLDGLSGASKFFYCPKVSRAERHVGFDVKIENTRPQGEAFGDGNLMTDATETSGNNHPTVKPVELMKYLVRLVTPAGGRVLDPFNGSGSTGMACVELGYDYTGCELDPDYVEIARNRIRAWEKRFDQPKYTLFD